MDINLRAGRELDVLVAERVLGGMEGTGYRCPECGGHKFRPRDGKEQTCIACHFTYFGTDPITLKWSTDTTTAMELLETVAQARKWRFYVIHRFVTCGSDYVVEISIKNYIPDPEIEERADTLSLAICRAILAACEVKP